MDINKLTKLLSIKIFNALKNQNKADASAKLYAPLLIKYWEENNIVTDEQQLFYLANCITETGHFQSLSENLNYSAQRLMAVFPSLFKDLNIANQYANNPEKIANYVYDSRVRKNTMGNNTNGDGWKYRGRGLFQTTWKNNYLDVKNKTGIDVVSNPDLLAQPEMAVKSACIYWKAGNFNNKNLKEIRKGIAGSYFGYEDHVLPNYLELNNIYKKL